MVDMESLRRELTLLYVNRGYINSGAVIPDQEVTDGLLSLQIIEGRIAKIQITGNKWFKNEYLSDRIALDAGTPVNIIPLQNRLQFLQQDNRIRLIHAELRPGDRLGEGELQVDVEENRRFLLGLPSIIISHLRWEPNVAFLILQTRT